MIENAKQIAINKGYISTKSINGKKQHYLQWTEDGKKKSKYINDNDLDYIQSLIDARKNNKHNKVSDNDIMYFNTNVIYGEELDKLIYSVKKYKKRNIYKELENYIYSDFNKVFILYGLRRTGKTTLIYQAINQMNNIDFLKSAYIHITNDDDFAKLNQDLKLLSKNGYKYIFIDEITRMKDFINGSALLSDVYASQNMRIVLSGTDSLGFIIAANYQLYDRFIMCHTTFIPYREFEEVLGIHGIDEYIKYGGTMSMSGEHYNSFVFSNSESTDEYIDSSISNNIQHSLMNYQDSSHFRNLKDLYLNNELTSAINRIIEDMNHYFTIEVLTRDFKSNDFSISKTNIRNDVENNTDILDKVNLKEITKRLKNKLNIKNKDEQIIHINENHIIEIQEYLKILELIDEIDINTLPVKAKNNSRIIFTQPGMRYCQARALIKSLLKDEMFWNLHQREIDFIVERILSEIKGRMMEDIVLLETKKANKNKEVFKLHFAIGEIDMVIFDNENYECEIYEIKHSDRNVDEQFRFLVEEDKIELIENKYGKVIKKAVIYKGVNTTYKDIDYINVEEYLKKIGEKNE